jgi:hypothetical protein
LKVCKDFKNSGENPESYSNQKCKILLKLFLGKALIDLARNLTNMYVCKKLIKTSADEMLKVFLKRKCNFDSFDLNFFQ